MEFVTALDKAVIGQTEAKRALSVADWEHLQRVNSNTSVPPAHLQARTGIETVRIMENKLKITAIRVHKGAALKQLVKQIDVAEEWVLAFGDGRSDLSMAEGRQLVAMGDAPPKVKATASAIIRTVKEDGVAIYLDQ